MNYAKEKKPTSYKFYKTYEFVSTDLKLKGIDKDIYSIILSYCELKNTRICEISISEFVRKTNCCKQAVVNSLKRLVERSLITKKEEKHAITKYEISLNCRLIDNSLQNGLVNIIDKSKEWTGGCLQNGQDGCLESRQGVVHKIDNNKDIKNIKEYKDTDLLSETISHIDNDNLSNNYISDDSDSTELADDELPF